MQERPMLITCRWRHSSHVHRVANSLVMLKSKQDPELPRCNPSTIQLWNHTLAFRHLQQLEKGCFRFKYIHYREILQHFHPSHVSVSVARVYLWRVYQLLPRKMSRGSITKWGHSRWKKLPISCFPTVSCFCHQNTLQQLSCRLSINHDPKA